MLSLAPRSLDYFDHAGVQPRAEIGISTQGHLRRRAETEMTGRGCYGLRCRHA